MSAHRHVEESDLVQGLEEASRQALLAVFQEESCEAGTAVFSEGDAGEALYVVAAGRVDLKVWITVGDIQKTVLAAGPGAVFGEVSFMDRCGRSATAVAAEPTTLKILSRSDFDAFCAEHPAAGAQVLQNLMCLLAARLRETNVTMADLLKSEVEMAGARQLNFQYLISRNLHVRVQLSGGGTETGTVLQVEQSAAGHEMILRRPGADQQLVMIPYHAIESISFDLPESEPDLLV